MHSGDRKNPFVGRGELKTGGRKVFLERIRKALGHGDVSPAPTGEGPVREEGLVRQVAAGEGVVERWVAKAKGNGMVVHRVGSEASAVLGAIEASFSNHTVKKSVVCAGELGERFGVGGWLASKGIGEVRWGVANGREEAFGSEASITDCRAGLADTGSILVWSEAGFGRVTTLVVPVHVVLLPVSRVLPDLIDGLALAAGRLGGDGRLPSNVVVINGPSKTADIEMNLVTGVHGPKYVYVVLIEGM